MSKNSLQLLKGFKDVLPEHQAEWQFLISKVEKISRDYGFNRIDVPVLEKTNVYIKGTGKYTDVVAKELYSFEDKGGESVTLRPEFTPGIVRAYIEHGMLNKTQPVKLYTTGQVFRHDNPQAGRLRQFNQLDWEIIGSESPVLDAELIIIAYRLLESVGLPVRVHINSIGDAEDRATYIAKFKQYLSSAGRKKQLCENCKARYTKNPLRILDCKEATCQEVLEEAPQIVDFLNNDAKKHFMQVLDYLDDMEIEYQLDVRLVRGLDYYNRTTFEIYLKEEDPSKSQGSLVGGGRFDGLVETLGGRPTPAVGMAGGLERIINKMREFEIAVPPIHEVDVFVAQLGIEARKECFKLYEKLINANIKVGQNFSKDGLKQQLEKADHMKAKISLILGQKELMDKTIIIRDMNSGIQEIINYDKVVQEVKKRLDLSLTEVKSYKVNNSKNEIKDEPSTELSKRDITKAKEKHKDSKIILEDNINNLNDIENHLDDGPGKSDDEKGNDF